ncbi:MAG: AAA family ATPase, partial [Spartobacteria bacterium]|nr:AAA family ATPase [Spartobacteria bacterium]
EFKSSFSDAVIETLVAFANSHGGCVYVGLDDLGSPVPGFTIGKESIAKWVNEVKSKTQPSLIPDVDVQHVDGGSVLCVSIPEYPVKPVSCRGRYYKRVSNSNHQMNLNEIANLHLQTINLSWDYTVDPRHGMDDISLEKVALFIRTASELRGMNITDDPLIVLHKYELLRAEQITVGCFLLFCKDAGLLTTIDAGRFDSETIIRDNATIRGDLIAEVDACMNFVRKHISKRYVITGKPQRDEVWEYPLEAVREIVINMIVHRDYRAVADSSIKIFDNRIEFVNMGSLPEGVSLDDVLSGRNPSLPRNKQIASIFKEVGLIEKYGSGIRRVLQIYKQMGA